MNSCNKCGGVILSKGESLPKDEKLCECDEMTQWLQRGKGLFFAQ